jgi:hypothetical protein
MLVTWEQLQTHRAVKSTIIDDRAAVFSLFLIDDEPSTLPNDSPNRVNRAARIEPPPGSRQGAAARG